LDDGLFTILDNFGMNMRSFERVFDEEDVIGRSSKFKFKFTVYSGVRFQIIVI